MAYLEDIKIVHRDLAARNVLGKYYIIIFLCNTTWIFGNICAAVVQFDIAIAFENRR